jgi:hypothetical protein
MPDTGLRAAGRIFLFLIVFLFLFLKTCRVLDPRCWSVTETSLQDALSAAPSPPLEERAGERRPFSKDLTVAEWELSSASSFCHFN